MLSFIECYSCNQGCCESMVRTFKLCEEVAVLAAVVLCRHLDRCFLDKFVGFLNTQTRDKSRLWGVFD